MKKRIFVAVSGTSLSILAIVLLLQVWVSAQAESGQRIVGSWDVTVTPRDCTTGDPIPFLPAFNAQQTYNLGGTMLANDPGIPGPPIIRVGGHGIWTQTKRGYSVAFRVFKFNPDGSSAGKDVVRDSVQMGPSGDTYTSTGTVDVYDPAGNIVLTGCATTSATRFQ